MSNALRLLHITQIIMVRLIGTQKAHRHAENQQEVE